MHADCYTISSLTKLGNLYKIYSILLRIFGSTSIYTNINIAQLKVNLNLLNIVCKYIAKIILYICRGLKREILKLVVILVVRNKSSSKGSRDSISIYNSLINAFKIKLKRRLYYKDIKLRRRRGIYRRKRYTIYVLGR